MDIPECGLLTWFDGEFAGDDARTGAEAPPAVGGVFFTANSHIPLGRSIGNRPFHEKIENALSPSPPARFRLVVWIGKQVTDAYADDPVSFTHVLAHELRHVEQFLHNPQLHYTGNLAYQYLAQVSRDSEAPIPWCTVPQEWDAELRAREIVGLLYAHTEVSEHYKKADLLDLIAKPARPTLRGVTQQLQNFFRMHQAAITLMLRCPEVYGEVGRIAEFVDWHDLGVPSPIPPEGIAKDPSVVYID
jgi:hypothetical protein